MDEELLANLFSINLLNKQISVNMPSNRMTSNLISVVLSPETSDPVIDLSSRSSSRHSSSSHHEAAPENQKRRGSLKRCRRDSRNESIRSSFDMSRLAQATEQLQEFASSPFPSIGWPEDELSNEDDLSNSERSNDSTSSSYLFESNSATSKRRCRGLVRSRNSIDLYAMEATTF